ncbi:MAG: outer membrane beta-barrel protein, partial [Candidatus Eremiobacteraeota bacterium]|nr:outer membrane beta-barrel protein [Candidatus Eremiobacteraeota bacterium]
VKKTPLLFRTSIFNAGLGWAIEPTISRGARVTYASGKLTGSLEYNDGFYSGSHRAVEGSAGWQLDTATSVTLVFIAPQADTPGNTTATVANKTEFDLMISKQYGKLQLLPYVLYGNSPSSAAAGYSSDERALAAVMIANYAFNDRFSLAARVENVSNFSSVDDLGANADLVGYGPGSSARTYTLTPQYKYGHLFARAEYSRVALSGFTPGLAFGASGIDPLQSRIVIEIGAQY